MIEFGSRHSSWNFEPAIKLLHAPSFDPIVDKGLVTPRSAKETADASLSVPSVTTPGILGNFTEVWKLLSSPVDIPITTQAAPRHHNISNSIDTVELDFGSLGSKGVKWRDELDGADLEDNVEPTPLSAASLRTRKRAARRARAKEREDRLFQQVNENVAAETTTDAESGDELESLRRSPDRRALIASLLGRPRPADHSPPTSPSPPKVARTPIKKEWPVANPFLWSTPGATPLISSKTTVTANDGFTSLQRKQALIKALARAYPDDARYLHNPGLLEPAFMPLNRSNLGIHVFIDMSNISIGFHDCLKIKRDIPVTTRIRRVPMNFHNLALVLERGRPAAKRILGGSDRTATTDQAEQLGYEMNILDRVQKAKTPTPRKKSHTPNHQGSGYASASAHSYGETSGSETPFASSTPVSYKWSEQAVDEILHLKMSHSILDSDKPSTIVLATGDAAEAEYSDGFLRMVERALNKGWMVELVSFKMNTSSLYRRREFRQRWGGMFKWVILDDFAEYLIDGE